MRQIRDVITSSVSFTFGENEFAADNKASLPFQLLFNIFIFLCFFLVFFVVCFVVVVVSVSFSAIEISPG